MKKWFRARVKEMIPFKNDVSKYNMKLAVDLLENDDEGVWEEKK